MSVEEAIKSLGSVVSEHMIIVPACIMHHKNINIPNTSPQETYAGTKSMITTVDDSLKFGEGQDTTRSRSKSIIWIRSRDKL